MNFAFRQLKGPRSDVIASINADPKASPEAKQYLVWLINATPHAGITVDCHAQTHGGDFVQHIHIKKLY